MQQFDNKKCVISLKRILKRYLFNNQSVILIFRWVSASWCIFSVLVSLEQSFTIMHAYDALTAISSVLFPYNQGIFFNKNNPSPVDSWRKGEGCPLAIFSYSFPSRFNQSAWNHYQRQLCVCFRAFLPPAFTGKAMRSSRATLLGMHRALEKERRWMAELVIRGKRY